MGALNETEGVVVRFQYFAHDKCFINAARHRAVCERLGRQPAAEMANKARVRKVYFRRLDDALIDVQGERLQKIDNVGCLQNREPALYRFTVDADVPRERCSVQQLSRPAREGGHKLRKSERIADGAELFDVAFNIGIHIGCIVLFPIHVLVRVQFGYTAAMDPFPQVLKGRSRFRAAFKEMIRGGQKRAVERIFIDLSVGKSELVDNAYLPRKAFAYPFHESILL